MGSGGQPIDNPWNIMEGPYLVDLPMGNPWAVHGRTMALLDDPWTTHGRPMGHPFQWSSMDGPWELVRLSLRAFFTNPL